MNVAPVGRGSIGSLLGDAFRLYAANWWQLVLLTGIILLPAGVLDFVVGRHEELGKHVFANILFGKFAFPGSAAIMLNQTPSSPVFLFDQFGDVVIAISLPIAAAAIIETTAATLLGPPMRLRDALYAGLSRWLDCAQIGILWYVCPLVLWQAFTAIPQPPDPNMSTILFSVLVVVVVVVTVLLMLAFFASVASAEIMSLDPVHATFNGLSLIFRRSFGRSLAIGLVLAVIYAGTSALILLFRLLPNTAPLAELINGSHEFLVIVFYPYAVIAVSLHVFDEASIAAKAAPAKA